MSEPLSPTSTLHEQQSSLPCDIGGALENQHEIASRFWSRSLKKSEKHDKELVDTWKGDADGILIFTGLFSSTVASFILESYKTLQRDTGDVTVQFLSQISGQLVAISNGTALLPPLPPTPFRPASGSVRVNVLWFLSLCLSLTCALMATLMHQWSRNYLQMAQGRGSDLAAQARLRAFAFDGVSRFQMSHALGLVPLLLHISVFLFFLGMVDFLFPINNTVTFVVLGFVVAVASTYLLLTLFPLFYLNFPYSTPLSSLVWRLTDFPARLISTLHWLVLSTFRLWTAYRCDIRHWQDARDDTLFSLPSVYHQFRIDLRKRFATQAVNADASVLGKQLIRELDITEDVDEIEAFFEGMHAALAIDTSNVFRPVVKYLVEHQMLLSFRFQCLFDSCDSTLPEPIRYRRALVGVRALWDVFSLKPDDHPFRLLVGAPFEGPSATSWFHAMAPLLHHEERSVAAAARCIQAIVASNAVTKSPPEYTDAADLSALTALVNPPPGLRHAVRDTESLRANGGLLVLVNLLEDLTAPLLGAAAAAAAADDDDDDDDALSAQIARIVGEVVPWLFPPWELRARVEPVVRDALADACEFVDALAEGQRTLKKARKQQPPHSRPPRSTRTVTVPSVNRRRLCVERQDAFVKLVEELRALKAFVCDDGPQHASRDSSDHLPHPT